MGSHDSDRRNTLAKLVIGGMSLIGAALAGLIGAVATPRAAGKTLRWKRAASIFDLPPNVPYPAVLADRHADGWYETRKETVVYLDREGDGYRALSATCSHLGCRVAWDDSTKHFHCPCHGGTYDRDGKVIAGPPPAPLTRLAVRVNKDTSEIEVEL